LGATAQVISADLNPLWRESFHFARAAGTLRIEVWDWNRVMAHSLIASATVELSELTVAPEDGPDAERWYPLSSEGKGSKGQVCVRLVAARALPKLSLPANGSRAAAAPAAALGSISAAAAPTTAAAAAADAGADASAAAAAAAPPRAAAAAAPGPHTPRVGAPPLPPSPQVCACSSFPRGVAVVNRGSVQ
jgi:hypothetical protein